MKIHTDSLTVIDLVDASNRAGDRVVAEFTEHGSRKRARSFNVTLSGTSGRRQNPGHGGGSRENHAATWDEWGMFLAELFRRDPEATIPGVYDTSGDFDYKTACRFDTLTPAYQHGGSGHRWEFVGIPREQECKTCEAVRRF